MARDPIKISPVMRDYMSAQMASLPTLPDVQSLTASVVRIMGGNPGEMQLQGTNTFLVGSGRSRILIDTGQGMPVWIRNMVHFLDKNDLEISHVLLTHWHGDHTEGLPDLIRYKPELASRVYKNNPDPGQHPIYDQQVFKAPGATVRAVFSPGHAEDHMCFVLEEENAMFTGDNVLGHGYSVCEDLSMYMTSLRYMASQNCRIGYPAHGVTIPDLPAKITQYIRQKELRERQVYTAMVKNEEKTGSLGTLRTASVTVRELVNLVHGDMGDEMVRSALEPSVAEVLSKLASDQKVGFEVKVGCKRWFLKKGKGGLNSNLVTMVR